MRHAFGSGSIPILGLLAVAGNLIAQIDPTKRELIQVGYNQALEGKAPVAAYAFYYHNNPEAFSRSNLAFRLALAPVYIDSELGIRDALGPHTDLGIGLYGGGFAFSYSEVRQGSLIGSESFLGHGGGTSLSVYHLFNPEDRIPLYAVVRGAVDYNSYSDGNQTADNFQLPSDQAVVRLRAGLRWGVVASSRTLSASS